MAKICTDICLRTLSASKSFLTAKLEENSELGGTDNVQGQISVYIFEAKWRLLSFKCFFSQTLFFRAIWPIC